MASNQRYRLVSHHATVTVPPHQLGGSGLLQHNGTSSARTARRRSQILSLFCRCKQAWMDATRPGSLEPWLGRPLNVSKQRAGLTALRGLLWTLRCPCLETWLSVKHFFHRLTVFLQEALRRGQAWGDTQADCLSPTLPVCLPNSPYNRWYHPSSCMAECAEDGPCVCVCDGCDALCLCYVRTQRRCCESHSSKLQIPAEVSHKQTENVSWEAGGSIKSWTAWIWVTVL